MDKNLLLKIRNNLCDGKTQQEVADMLGINYSTFSRYFSEAVDQRRRIPWSVARKMSQMISVPVEDIMQASHASSMPK